MKFRNIFLAALAATTGIATWTAWAFDGAPIDSATGDVDHVTIKWQAEQGATYRVVAKSDLADTNAPWEQRSGYLSTDTGWTLEQGIDVTNTVEFFRIEKIDQTGPEFTFLSPAKDAVSVDPDAEIRIGITDQSGVSTAGLGIWVGDTWHAYGEDADVTWADGVLAYAGGALGEPGAVVPVWAVANDTLGNPGRCETSLLTLASDLATIETNDFIPFVVIGSGMQTVDDLVETATTSARSTSSARSTALTGTIGVEEVGGDGGEGDNYLTFRFTGDGWKLLATNQLWASSAADQIFYRRVVTIDAPDFDEYTITAWTEEATLADFFVGGSFSSDNGEWTEYDVVDNSEEEAISAQSRRRHVQPRIGGSTSRSFSTNGVLSSDWINNKIPAAVPLKFDGDLGQWDVSAGFSVAADFGILKRKFNTCDLAVNGQAHVHLNPTLVATTNAAYSNTWTKTIADVKKTFGGTIGPIPIWVDLSVEIPAELSLQAQATNASVAAIIDISRALDYHWKLSDDAWQQVGSGNPGWVIAQTNFTYEVEGSAGVRVSLKPTITIKVYSLVGAYGWVEPYLECNAVGRVQGQNLAAPDFYYLLTAYAGLNAEIGLASTIWSDSWGTPPHKTFSPLRKQLLHLEGTNTPPRIVTAPVDLTAENGETVMLSAMAEGTWPLRYAWYHNGVDTGRRDSYITLRAGSATAGEYTVQVSNGYGTDSASVQLSVVTNIAVVGAWRFLYQWEGEASCSYGARLYADGGMRDTSPQNYQWDWYLNGKTIRFETREKWDGQSAVYRGTRYDDTFMSGTMVSPTGRTGTWSMEWVSADPDASLSNLRSIRVLSDSAAPDDDAFLDPAGQLWLLSVAD
ncbi:MAG: hypothetical protein IJT88_09680 [Kiritimatiellae bacterium]|nr:hypothetical protein [Kiritimatiellia bacterium]